MESFIFPIYLTNAMLLKIARKQLFVLRHNNISKIALPNAISNKHHKTSLTTTRSSRHLTCCTHSCLSRATKKKFKRKLLFFGNFSRQHQIRHHKSNKPADCRKTDNGRNSPTLKFEHETTKKFAITH
uniref:(northern house mosquito) hypothetical protein n=1 Tax=Culex pipiens TaxID=7175 RepID=A0A8D8KT37_CULPI